MAPLTSCGITTKGLSRMYITVDDINEDEIMIDEDEKRWRATVLMFK